MITAIETNTALCAALKANGYDDIGEAIYDLLGVEMNSSVSLASMYRGMAVIVFESMLGDCWMGLSVGHSTFMSIGDSYDSAKARLHFAIDKVLNSRALSPMEQQQNNALARSLAALYKVEGKDGVNTVASVLTAVLAGGKSGPMQDACRYLAMYIGANDVDVSEKTRDWSELNLLKLSLTTNEIESMIRKRVTVRTQQN